MTTLRRFTLLQHRPTNKELNRIRKGQALLKGEKISKENLLPEKATLVNRTLKQKDRLVNKAIWHAANTFIHLRYCKHIDWRVLLNNNIDTLKNTFNTSLANVTTLIQKIDSLSHGEPILNQISASIKQHAANKKRKKIEFREFPTDRLSKEYLVNLENEIKDALYIQRALTIKTLNEQLILVKHPRLLSTISTLVDVYSNFWQKKAYFKCYNILNYIEEKEKANNKPPLSQEERYALINRFAQLSTLITILISLAAFAFFLYNLYERIAKRVHKSADEINLIKLRNDILNESIKGYQEEANALLLHKKNIEDKIQLLLEDKQKLESSENSDEKNDKRIKKINDQIDLLNLSLEQSVISLKKIHNQIKTLDSQVKLNIDILNHHKSTVKEIQTAKTFLVPAAKLFYDQKKQTFQYATSTVDELDDAKSTPAEQENVATPTKKP